MNQYIVNLFNEGKLEEAKREIDKMQDTDVDKWNFLGNFYFNNSNFEMALQCFEKGIEIDPSNDDILFNCGYMLKENDEFGESWRYLKRIKNKDSYIYQMLAENEEKFRSKILALWNYKKALKIEKNEEIEDKYDKLKFQIKKNERVLFICLPDQGTFIKNIYEIISDVYDTKLVITKEQDEIKKAVEWADIIWIEWANELTEYITNNLEIKTKKIICRLHSYEIFTEYPKKINWKNVDTLIFVSEEIKRMFFEFFKESRPYNIAIMPNGIDLDNYDFNVHSKGKNIGIAAAIGYKKDPSMWLQVMMMLKNIETDYKLHIAGEFHEVRYKKYFEYLIPESDLMENIIFHGYIKNIDEFWKTKDYVLSTSIHEGHPLNIIEAMAMGIKPIIHNYRGAKTQWPQELIYNSIIEIPGIIRSEYNSEKYRRYIENNYTIENQIYLIENIFNSVKSKREMDKVLIEQEKLYYDNFVEYLKKSHSFKNPRHNHIKESLSNILIKEKEVLDIGCGTGIISKFIAESGCKVTAVDISDKMIEFARENSYDERINYIVSNASTLELDRKFDYITFVDSMEHISKNYIDDLFNVIKKHSYKDTTIYINIPDARYQDYMRDNHPERLQNIDEAYYIDFILNKFRNIDFEVIQIKIYGIDLPVQYVEMILINKEKVNLDYKENLKKYFK